MTSGDYGRAYEQGFKATLRFLQSKGAGYEIAEEAAQAAWSRGWERIHQLRDEELLRTWVNTIAFNMFRRSVTLEKKAEALTTDESVSRSHVNTAAIDLQHLLELCPSRYRQLLLQQMQGWTAKELAEKTGTSETAVRIRMMRARRSARSVAEEMRHAA